VGESSGQLDSRFKGYYAKVVTVEILSDEVRGCYNRQELLRFP
jgi:hypothetical protein